MSGTGANQRLDDLLTRLEEMLARTGKAESGKQNAQTPDAIDQVLSVPPRVTNTRSLRDHAVVQKFREEMLTGLIQVDTAHQLLGLIGEAMKLAMV